MNSLSKTRAKEKAQTLKESLAKLGYDVGIRHCYEVIAKQSGYETWNSMSAKLVDTENLEVGPSINKQMQALKEIAKNGLHEAYSNFDEWEYDFMADFSWKQPESSKQILALMQHPEFKKITEAIQKEYNYDVYTFLSKSLKSTEPSIEWVEGIGSGDNVYDFEVFARARVKTTFKVRGTHPGHAYTNLEKFISENEAAVFSGEDWEVDSNIGIDEYKYPDIGYSTGLHKTRNIVPTRIESDETTVENEKGISWQSVQRES